MLRKYETLFILRPDLTDDEFDRVKTRLKDIVKENEGVEIVYQDWGKKRLAYPIRKYPKGNYVYVRYLGLSVTVAEVERFMKVSEEALRFMTTRLADRVDPESFDIDEDRIGIYPFNVKPREVTREEGEEGAEGEKPAADAPEAKTEEAAAKAEEPATEEKAKAEKAEEPKAEKAEAPKAEKAAEPKAEVAEEPKAEKAAEPKAEKAEEPKAEKAEEPKAEKAEEPKAEVAEEPKAEVAESEEKEDK